MEESYRNNRNVEGKRKGRGVRKKAEWKKLKWRKRGCTEEFIKNNIKNGKRGKKQTKSETEREAESWEKRKENLFMIHHIDSPWQLEWWRQGNIGVYFICYSVLRCDAVGCRVVVLWSLSCLGHVWERPPQQPQLTSPSSNPSSPSIHSLLSVFLHVAVEDGSCKTQQEESNNTTGIVLKISTLHWRYDWHSSLISGKWSASSWSMKSMPLASNEILIGIWRQ